MKRFVALLAVVALMAVIVPSLAMAEDYEGDLIITEPGLYENLQVTGNVIIKCGGVVLSNVSCATVFVEGEGADVFIAASCDVENVEVAESATGASVVINGTVSGSVTILASAVSAEMGEMSVINNIVIGANAYAAVISIPSGAQLTSVTNNSSSTVINAPAEVAALITFDGEVPVNLIY